jgi:hypothetical protein
MSGCNRQYLLKNTGYDVVTAKNRGDAMESYRQA